MTHPIKIGDTLELAIWLTGAEPKWHIDQWGKDAPMMLTQAWPELRITLSPLRWAMKRIGDERVPEPPPGITGPGVRLLVLEADVTTIGQIPQDRAFVGDLDKRDLARLRGITKRACAEAGRVLTDDQADFIIETLGPQSAARVLRDGATLQ